MPQYDLSVWVDANVDILGDINDFILEQCSDEKSVFIPSHPMRNCIYSEAKTVILIKKDTKENVEPQIKRYKEEGFPVAFGLPQSNIIVRKHNEEECVKLMDAWWSEIEKGSHRDQLSFSYALWKTNSRCVKYIDKKTCRSKWFHWSGSHGAKAKRKSPSLIVTPTTTLKVSKPKPKARKVVHRLLSRNTYNILNQY